mgnify:CR=1 FL=1
MVTVRNVDVVHFHAAAEWLQPAVVAASVATVAHIRGVCDRSISDYTNPIFVSRRHAEDHGGNHYVYNGIDPETVAFESEPEGYLAFLGKVRRSKKGARTAIAVANEKRREIRVAGGRKLNIPQTWLPFQRYTKVLGVLDSERKMGMVGRASALLFPIQWEEPFGLVLIEAMAAGTPVIAFDRGAVPEIVRDGVTGFVVRDFREMCDAVDRIEDIERSACRRHVEDMFSIDATAKGVMAYYERALRGEFW